MTRLSRLAAAGLLALSLSTGATAADQTLYERLGGKATITAVVNELWDMVSTDTRISGRFVQTKSETFTAQLIEFLCEKSGGPCKYQGQDMKAVHAGMRLSDAEFAALAQDAAAALDSAKVPAPEKKEVMGLLGSLRNDIVDQ